jgi:hypothetical protein
MPERNTGIYDNFSKVNAARSGSPRRAQKNSRRWRGADGMEFPDERTASPV